jgi:hypothetical protein
MLSTHLRHRELCRVRNLTWRRHRRVRRFATAQLPGQITDHPPMHLRPVHSDPVRPLDYSAPRRTARTVSKRSSTMTRQPVPIPGLPESRCRGDVEFSVIEPTTCRRSPGGRPSRISRRRTCREARCREEFLVLRQGPPLRVSSLRCGPLRGGMTFASAVRPHRVRMYALSV